MDTDRRRKVITIPLDRLGDVLAGRARLISMPRDGVVSAWHALPNRRELALMVHSASFDPVPYGAPAPVAGPPIIESTGARHGTV